MTKTTQNKGSKINSFQRGLAISLVLFLSAVFMPIHSVHAEVEFDCPDLRDERKRSIEPLSQGLDGWFFRKNDLKMDYALSPETLSYLKRLDQALEDKGTNLVVLPLLSRTIMAQTKINPKDDWQEDYTANLAQLSYTDFIKGLKDTGISIIDLSGLFDIYKSADPYQYNFKRDIHWKPEGAKLVAELTSAYLKDMDGYDTLTKVEAVSEKMAEVPRSGTITIELQKLCNDVIGVELFEPYTTKRVIENNADALFGGDDETTPVAIVGTSFSAVDEFNFVGFLEEQSDIAMANFSIPGGGMFTSITSYLSSPFFQDNIPPVMVWETQSVYDFNKGTSYDYRQVIPAVYGSCAVENRLAQNTVSLSRGDDSLVLLDNIENLKAGGTDFYLHIQADDMGFKQFTLELDYDNQDGEWFPVDRSDRYDNKGHFFFELSNQIDGALSKVVMKNPQDTKTELVVSLCRKPGAGKEARLKAPKE